ncbi:MAG: hypothetical protein IT443_04750 [Phycisphaeraceae bacterium]|nr:hypothetical protein [Phycisphaeraceae bacterium]
MPAFRHRMLLDWINDVSTPLRAGKRWPIIDVDEQTLRDYQELFSVARDWGYNGITIWGLYVDHAWPVDLKSCLTPARKKIIDGILDAARRCGITVYSGMGVYTWGFEEIIRAHPQTSRNEGRWCYGRFVESNGVAMCYHQPAAREWMRKIIDFAVQEMGVQGFGFQSADQGRCYCSQCRQLGDMEYHALVNAETAQYTRERWPGVKLSVSGWGINFDKDEDWPHLKKMAGQLDFITDVMDQSFDRGREYRRKLIQTLPCDFGSLGRTVVVPPQRWERDRWFLPHARLLGQNISQLAADGGKAFEFFAGPLANPQFDLMTRYVGRMLTHPEESIEKALGLAVDDVLGPHTPAVRDSLVQWLLEIERVYFSRVTEVKGEFDYEPLMGVDAGPPIYLDRLRTALADFGQDMRKLQEQYQPLRKQCRQEAKAALIDRCLTNVQKDIRWRLENPKT